MRFCYGYLINLDLFRIALSIINRPPAQTNVLDFIDKVISSRNSEVSSLSNFGNYYQVDRLGEN